MAGGEISTEDYLLDGSPVYLQEHPHVLRQRLLMHELTSRKYLADRVVNVELRFKHTAISLSHSCHCKRS